MCVFCGIVPAAHKPKSYGQVDTQDRVQGAELLEAALLAGAGSEDDEYNIDSEDDGEGGEGDEDEGECLMLCLVVCHLSVVCAEAAVLAGQGPVCLLPRLKRACTGPGRQAQRWGSPAH